MPSSAAAHKAKYPTHRPHGKGRIAEDETTGPRIPPVTRAQILAVDDWLTRHRNVRRPLTVAAPLLALVCALHHKEQYFPTRSRIAAWLRDEGYAEWESERPNSVDKAIQAAVSLQEIEIRYAVHEGNAAAGQSILRRRYLVPSRQLLYAFDDATTSFGRACVNAGTGSPVG